MKKSTATVLGMSLGLVVLLVAKKIQDSKKQQTRVEGK
jgi:hypothetical protein